MNDIEQLLEDAQLTDKQRAFVQAYIGEANLNGSRAATIAGYKEPRQAASENLQKPHIKRIVNSHLDKVRDQGIANKAFRIAELNKLYEKVSTIAEEEGLKQEAYTNQGKQYKTFSKDVLSSLQSIMEQAAKEVGDRDSRLKIDADVRVETTSAKDTLLSLIQDDSSEE